MSSTSPKNLLSTFHTVLFYVLFTNLVSYQFLPSVSQAGWLSSEKSPKEIAKEYGDTVVLIAAFDKNGKLSTADSETPESSSSAEEHYVLGNSYYNEKKYDLAIKEYEEAIRIKPDYAGAHYNLGLVYSLKGQNDLAIRHTEQALLLDPNNKPASELLDVLYRRKRGY